MVKSGYFIYENNMAVGRPSLVGGFAFPGALVGNYPDCMENATAPFDIRAGRKSEVWIMDGKLLPDIYDSDPDACRQGRILTEQSYKSLRQRYMDLCINTPAERYLNLIRRHPQIEQDIPQKWIAKYLQISPVHLCRIRKEQMKQQ